jgi:hypothetical protein
MSLLAAASRPSTFFALLASLSLTTVPTFAQDPPPVPPDAASTSTEAVPPSDEPHVRLGATIFANYTYNEAPTSLDTDGNTIHPSSFDITRAYINVTGSINHFIAYRVTPDVSRQTTTLTGGPSGEKVSTSNDGSLLFRLKYAFGQFSLDNVVTKGSWVRVGLSQSPWIEYYETTYRYRFQGKTWLDNEGYLSTADFGVYARVVAPNDYGDVIVAYDNGDGFTKADPNDQKGYQIRGSLRPFPKQEIAKGFRVAAFYDGDNYVQNGDRKRFVAEASFQHPYLDAGVDYLDAKDAPSAKGPDVHGRGYSIFLNPKTAIGIEGLFRFDHIQPNATYDASKRHTIAGLAYWFKVKRGGDTAAALMADYEQVSYDTLPSGAVQSPIVALSRPLEKRYSIHTLFSF